MADKSVGFVSAVQPLDVKGLHKLQQPAKAYDPDEPQPPQLTSR